MDGYDPNNIGELINLAWKLIGGVLRLDPQAFQIALNAPRASTLALIVVFLAGVSNTLGHSVVLFANRVRRSRFLFSLLIEALVFVGGVFLWALSIKIIAETLFSTRVLYEAVLTTVALGYAPLLFGFLILLPYLGNIIYQVLRVWVLLAVIVGTAVTYQFPFGQVFIITLMGWILLIIIVRIPFLRIQRFDNWLWRIATGSSSQLNAEQAVAQFMDGLDKNGKEEPQR